MTMVYVFVADSEVIQHSTQNYNNMIVHEHLFVIPKQKYVTDVRQWKCPFPGML